MADLAARIDALGAISEEEGRLTRRYLTPAHRRAADLVGAWMREAGLEVTEDALGTVRGRRGTGPAILIGSHIDTVVDAGRFDGALGVLAGIEAAAQLAGLPVALEVLAFGDEEGVRFPATLLSSSACAGAFDPARLALRGQDGLTLRDALAAYGAAGDIAAAAYRREDVLGYLEVHIEQGPVLEAEGLALGVVTAIAGQLRAVITVEGAAGHAGTVPMAGRRDALAAAAELVLEIERTAAPATAGLVATVGEIAALPGASNVIPGGARLTLDLRAADNRVLDAALATIDAAAGKIATRRGTPIAIEVGQITPTTPMDPGLTRALEAGVAACGLPVRRLPSGAGHDAIAMAPFGAAMLFVRCRGGISHNPAEHAEPADMALAVDALTHACRVIAR